MSKFESVDTKQQYDAIMEQLRELRNKEYDCLRSWTDELKFYIDDVPTSYFLLNGNTYIMKTDFTAGVVKSGAPIHWARIEGLIIHDGEDTICDSFSNCVNIRIGDTLERICLSDYSDAFYRVCFRVFADTEENFNYQYENYPFRFMSYIYEQFNSKFSKKADEFCKRLQKKLDDEDNN